MTNIFKLLLASLIEFHLLLSARGQLTADLFLGRFKVSGAVIPFYNGTEQQPAMVMRVGSIFTDCERRGFFRIGLLPVEVLEEVTFDISHPTLATNSLIQLHDWIKPKAAKHLEFRKVSFLVGEGISNRLESGRARIVSADTWELFDGVRFCTGTNQIKAPRATFHLAGAKTGQIIMATRPPLTNNLFACSKIPTTQMKVTP